LLGDGYKLTVNLFRDHLCINSYKAAVLFPIRGAIECRTPQQIVVVDYDQILLRIFERVRILFTES